MLRAFLFFLGSLVATSASAQSVQTAYAGKNAVVLTIPVTASVGGRCGFADGAAPQGSFTKDNFDRDGFSAQFNFSLNCTGPSRVAIVSANGGLKSSQTVAAGYTNSADYNVTLNLLANNGAAVQSTCAASSLAPGAGCSFVGQATTTNGLLLPSAALNQAGSYVRVNRAAQAGNAILVAGSYTDSLTITVSPAL